MEEESLVRKVKREKSLEYWIRTFVMRGVAIVCLVVLIMTMFMYMRSVRRIFKANMKKSIDVACMLVGEDKIREICLGDNLSEAEIKEGKDAFGKCCKWDDFTDMVLYSVKGDQAELVFDANGTVRGTDKERFSADTLEMDKMRDSESYMRISYSKKGGLTDDVWLELTDSDGEVYGILLARMPLSNTLFSRLRFFLFYVPLFAALVIIFGQITSRALQIRVVKPLSELDDKAVIYMNMKRRNDDGERQEIQCFRPPETLNEDEIGALWLTLADMEVALDESVVELLRVSAEKKRAEMESDLAAQIQAGMLPLPLSDESGRDIFSIDGSMNPAKNVGGDFYDYFMIDSDHLVMFIGDVSGKGMPAALFMMMSMTQVKTQSAGCLSPAEILSGANEKICGMNRENLFLTIWIAVVNLSTGEICECNAGHEDPAIYLPGEGYVIDEYEHDLPLGIMPGLEFTEKTRILRENERIFVYSDGLPEAMREDEQLFGTERMTEALNRHSDLDDRQLLAAIQNDVDQFVGEADQFDDLTMLSFRYKGK